MNIRLARKIFSLCTLALLMVSCTVASAHSRSDVAPALQRSQLAECDRPFIALGPAPAASAVAQGAAEAASGVIGVDGAPDIALLTTVTIGTHLGLPATSATALIDPHGAPIVSRPAWVFVFRNQQIRTPTVVPIGPNGTFTNPAATPRSDPAVATVATVVDAQTGALLRGWGCGFRAT